MKENQADEEGDSDGDADRLAHRRRSYGRAESRTTASGLNFALGRTCRAPARRVQADHRIAVFVAAGRRYSRLAVPRVTRIHLLFGARPGSALLFDVAIAAFALVGSLAQLSHGGIGGDLAGRPHGGPDGLDWTGGVLAACSTLPLLGWRRGPRAVFLLTGSAAVLLRVFGYPLALALGPAVALFLLAASRSEADPWRRIDTGLAIGLFIAYIGAGALDDGDFPENAFLHTGLAWSVGWFAGDRTRLRHEHVADLAERAARTERDAERDRLLAVAEERARIARDLHDSAGHAINVITIRAGTARMRGDPERSQAALEAIEELARTTGGEIDRLVGTLRERGDASAPVEEPPGLGSLDSLLARYAAAGLEVSLSSEGASRQLAGSVDQAAYRILQEALTNAARHGSGAARVELSFSDESLELTVSNAAVGRPGSRVNGGHGLIGMQERAALVGGSLDVERANGTFRIRASLPYEGAR
jgi:signal transduction histidine kinase